MIKISLHAHTPQKDYVGTARTVTSDSQEADPYQTLIRDFQPPELRNTILLFKLIQWYFVKTVHLD